MPRIARIPEQYQRGFVHLYSIDDESFLLLVDALAKSGLAFGPSNLARKIDFGSKDPGVFTEIFLSVGSLIPVRERNTRTSEEIVDDICDLLRINQQIDFKNDSDVKKYKRRLVTLLENEQLLYSSKSVELATDYENIFISSKVTTDIRPVFGKNIGDNPKAALIVHNLQLHYHVGEEDEHRDLYVALDATDIKNLQEVLSRALEKENTLAKLLEASSIVNLKFKAE